MGETFQAMQNLVNLNFERNLYTGPLPLDAIAEARGLTKLNLNFNLWTGSIGKKSDHI